MSKLSQLKDKVNKMTNTEALEILEQYQAWRRGADTEMLDVKDISEALDIAIEKLKNACDKQLALNPKVK